MKKTVSREKIEKARELAKVIEIRKIAEKKESELKDYFKDELKEDNAIQAGDVLIIAKERERKGLDRKELFNVFGEEMMAKFETVTTYTQIEVIKKVA